LKHKLLPSSILSQVVRGNPWSRERAFR